MLFYTYKVAGAGAGGRQLGLGNEARSGVVGRTDLWRLTGSMKSFKVVSFAVWD